MRQRIRRTPASLLHTLLTLLLQKYKYWQRWSMHHEYYHEAARVRCTPASLLHAPPLSGFALFVLGKKNEQHQRVLLLLRLQSVVS